MGIAGVVVPAVSTGRTFSRRVRVKTALTTAAPTELNGSSKTSSVAEPATESEVFNWTKVRDCMPLEDGATWSSCQQHSQPMMGYKFYYCSEVLLQRL